MASHVGLPVMKLPLMRPAPWPIQTPPTRTTSAPMIKPMVRASFDRDHVSLRLYRVTRNSRSSSPDGSPLPSVLELLSSRLFPSWATATVRSRP